MAAATALASVMGRALPAALSLFSKPIEFDGIKIGIVELFPDAEELNGIAVAEPVLNDVVGPFRVTVAGDVGEGDVVVMLFVIDRNLAAFDVYGSFPLLSHSS